MKLLKIILNWFVVKPKIQSFPGKPMAFYRFVIANYKLKSYGQAIREVFSPKTVTVVTLKAYKKLWDLVVADIKRRNREIKKIN